MSLTRAEWLDMWTHIKAIERFVQEETAPHTGKRHTLRHVQKIKDHIQDVVGQLENDRFRVPK